ncbi:MAG: TrbC/VirB2 family protein [bacterium]|nr:TrbC/VirB2 family protein [bacterium]
MTCQTKKIISFLAVAAFISVLALPVLAQTAAGPDLGLKYGEYTGLSHKDIRQTVGSIISIVLGLLGIVAVIIIIIGGFTWMTAAGNTEKVDKSKKLLTAGVIGLVIIMSAYIIASFVITELINATYLP